ncbi:tumor protein 63-like [Anabas testudineus]|uniref:tumor protein 63-like n=1 Tax=Anabas testudineus TaxID=64144 RepID=UPI000E45FCD5|nr:tumor protein 63-like [Anabas testudineus]
MNSPYTAVQYYPEFSFHRLRDPSSRLSWRESSFLTTMSQNQSAQTADFFSQDVFNQLFDMLDQSAIHSVQPIELNFMDSPTDGSAGNTIQISMDCITMHEPDETLSKHNC